MITIVGPGGIGKTTVARAVAELDNSYDDGVFLVDLSLVPNAESVPAAIATALNRTALSGNALEPALQYLKTRKTLLILDCCEHVIEAAALVADQILAAAPVTRILATSREPLRLPAEMVEHLDALGTPPPSEELTATEAVRFPAIELFRRVAAAGAKDFKVDNFNVKRVAEICYRLDGIPLAIELAASLVGVFGIAEVERGLDEKFAILTLGRRTSLPRHRTLAAALDWSYEWLPAQEQAVLRRVAAFLGSFTMDRAIAVATGGDIRDSHVRQSIIALASKSLLSVQRGADQTVYRLLETTRAYALQVPHPTGERERAARQHASYILNVLESMDWESYDAANGRSTLVTHIEELRSALEWAFVADLQAAVRLTLAAERPWFQLALYGECDRANASRAGADRCARQSAPSRFHRFVHRDPRDLMDQCSGVLQPLGGWRAAALGQQPERILCLCALLRH